MKDKFKPSIDEQPGMIISGVLELYLLVEFFIVYLYFLHRINLTATLVSTLVFTLIYLPRFLILNKLKNKDKIQIVDDFLMINDIGIALADIEDFRTEIEKPQVVFFINNKMIVFQQAKFFLKLKNGTTSFTVVGGEKIKLLEEFLKSNKQLF